MAERGGLLTSLLSEDTSLFSSITSHDSANATDTPNGFYLKQDAECAMTLLQLAQSAATATVKQVGSVTGQNELDMPSSNIIQKRRSPVTKNASPVSRQRWAATSRSQDNMLPQRKKSPEIKSEERKYRDEIVKRIKLDHNYFWTGYGEFKYKVAKMLPTETVESLDECMGSKKNLREISAFSPTGRSVRPIPSSGPIPQCRIKIDLDGKVRKEKSPRRPDDSDNYNITSSQGNYNCEADDKYRKFNLLLNCLVSQADSNMLSDIQCNTEHGTDTSGLCGYPLEEGEGKEQLGHMDEDGEFSCSYCGKQFLGEQDLTNHISRLHSNALCEEGENSMNIFSLCPHCKHHVVDMNSKKGSNHIEQCRGIIECSKKTPKSPVPDTAVCQFCQVRFKRHMLVKHLAQEHCVDHKGESLKMSDGEVFFPQGLYSNNDPSSTQQKLQFETGTQEEQDYLKEENDLIRSETSEQIDFEPFTNTWESAATSGQAKSNIFNFVRPDGSNKPVTLKL